MRFNPKKLRSHGQYNNNPSSKIKPDIFNNLSEEQMKAIIILLARVMEDSYRRGFQQGVSVYPELNDYTLNLIKTGYLRYYFSRDVSPNHVAEYLKKGDIFGYDSIDRLYGEYIGKLKMLNFHVFEEEETITEE